MSYAYRVTVTRSVRETVKGGDQSRNAIGLTGILPEERMKELLVEALERRGFARQEDGTWTRTADGVTETFDPATMEVTARAEVSGDIEKQKTVQAVGDANTARGAKNQRQYLEAEVGQRLEKELAVTDAERQAKSDQLAAEARRNLEQSEERRVRELNEATMETYAEALKEKAKQLGAVKEMQENRRDNGAGGTDYELVIKVEES